MMSPFVQNNLEHIFALLIFISRLGDIGTTYLASPKLKLEANPFIRRFRWPLAALSFLFCLTPYWYVEAGVMIMIVSLLVATSNSIRLWFVKAIGEDQYQELLLKAARMANHRLSIVLSLLPGAFMTIFGVSMLLFYPAETSGWGFYYALGILIYAYLLFLYVPLNYLRLRKRSSALPEQSPETAPIQSE